MIVRRVAASEWREVRELRLRALRDPNAELAFIGTHAEALLSSDDFWKNRAFAAADGGPNAQFVAIAPDGTWLGSATVLVDVSPLRASIVGVFVDPVARGDGTIDLLLDACATFVRSCGLREVFLTVHTANKRAQGAYVRAGFVDTGERIDSVIGEEMQMRRALA